MSDDSDGLQCDGGGCLGAIGKLGNVCQRIKLPEHAAVNSRGHQDGKHESSQAVGRLLGNGAHVVFPVTSPIGWMK